MKNLYEALCGSKSSCVKSGELPQVMSLESASIGPEDYKFEKLWGCGVRKEVRSPDLCSPPFISAPG